MGDAIKFVAMRTTIDIPDPMLRQVKAKCALEGRTMRSLALVFFSDWLRDGTATTALLTASDEGGEAPCSAPAGDSAPNEEPCGKPRSIRDLPMIGMWKDREDMADPVAWVREQRKPRFTI